MTTGMYGNPIEINTQHLNINIPKTCCTKTIMTSLDQKDCVIKILPDRRANVWMKCQMTVYFCHTV